MPSKTLPRSGIFRTAERAVGGDLKGYLRRARRAQKSFDQVAVDLHDLGVLVSGETVRNWCKATGVTS